MQEMQEVPGASQTEGSGKNNALQLDLYSCVIQEPEFWVRGGWHRRTCRNRLNALEKQDFTAGPQESDLVKMNIKLKMTSARGGGGVICS